jgi:hypothetical protein
MRENLFFSDRLADGRMVKAMTGGELVLDCEVAGAPPPTIHWLHNGHRIVQGVDRDVLDDEASYESSSYSRLSDSADAAAAGGSRSSLLFSTTKSRLHVDCVKPVDAGVYSCVAETPSNRIVTRTIVEVVSSNVKQHKRRIFGNNVLPFMHLGVIGGPSTCANKHSAADNGTPARVYMWTVNRIEMEGSDVQLYCRAAGSPQPQITWYDVDDRVIEADDPQYRLLPNGDLLIRDVSFSANMGVYRCVAENAAGTDASESFVYPTTAK